jgi:hypothetical protein
MFKKKENMQIKISLTMSILLTLIAVTTPPLIALEQKKTSRILTYSIPNNVAIKGSLAVSGASTLNHNLTTTGRARFTGAGNALQVTKNASIGGTLAVTGATTLNGATRMNHNLTTTGRARITGSGNALQVTNNATIGNKLNVSGQTTLTGDVTCLQSLSVADTIVTGSLFVDGVQITGTTGGGGGTSEGNLTVSGNARITGEGNALEITNNATIGGTLTVEGIAGTSVNVLAYAPVFVDTDSGILGTVLSSKRYKHDIKPLASCKNSLMQLQPVSFCYNTDPHEIKQYGLIAEEVAAVMPELVVFNKNNEPETVAYHVLPTLLLNEYQRQEQQLEASLDLIASIIKELALVKEQIKHLQGK